MVTKVDGWLSRTGRVFDSHAAASKDEEEAAMRKELMAFYGKAQSMGYVYPLEITEYTMQRRDELLAILGGRDA
jgi:hypothetical protein